MTQFLVADDSTTVRLMLRGWLEAAGHQVIEAADGLQALEHLRASTRPVAVLLDYQMPQLTGFEVLQHALAGGLLPPRYAYVMITSLQSTFPDAFTALLRQLAIQILPKPFDQGTFLAVAAFVAARLESEAAPPASA
jgi:two-component system chemotaxis response regulator CheY